MANLLVYYHRPGSARRPDDRSIYIEHFRCFDKQTIRWSFFPSVSLLPKRPQEEI